jgi:solute carrier family 10 (sodium/bile acid cotransporter), member 7
VYVLLHVLASQIKAGKNRQEYDAMNQWVWVRRNWFVLGLIIGFGAVLMDTSETLAGLGRFLKAHHGPSAAIFLIFVISGLVIEPEQIREGFRDVTGTLAALSNILIIAPATALVFTFLPLDPAIILGICLVSVMPTTLSTGVVMTGAAGGNMAHALFVTISANLLAIVTIPVILPFLISGLTGQTRLELDTVAVFSDMITLVLIPLTGGMILRTRIPPVTRQIKSRLQYSSQALILLIVFMSVGSARPVFLTMGSRIPEVILAVAGFHLILLMTAGALIRVLKIPRGRNESILFMGAQKTLPLAVMIQVTYFSEFGAALLVCLLHHFIHLIMDSMVCRRMQAASFRY